MSPAKRYAKKQAKARQRRRNAQERLEHDHRQAQQAAEAFTPWRSLASRTPW